MRHMSGPSLTRGGEFFELNVGVWKQGAIPPRSVLRRFCGSFLSGAECTAAWSYGLIPRPLLSPEKGSFLS